MRLFKIAVLFIACIALGLGAISQHSPKTPTIASEQQAQSAFKQQEYADTKPKLTKRPEERGNHDADHGGKEPPETYVAFGKSLKITDTAIAVFTLVIACFTIGLFWDGRAKGRKELRAYLGISGTGVRFPGNNHIQAYVEVTNTGKTPAHKVTQAFTAEIRSKDNDKIFTRIAPVAGKRPIVPGSTWKFRHDLSISDEEISQLQTREKVMFVWGKADYIDIFGGTQSIEFRYRNLAIIFDRDAEGHKRLVGWALHPEEDGNEST